MIVLEQNPLEYARWLVKVSYCGLFCHTIICVFSYFTSMGTIDYSALLDPTIQSTESEISVTTKNKELRFAKDIFEFILGEDFLNERELFPRQRKILDIYFNTLNEKGNRLFQELVIISGMRSGKTRMAAWIGAYQIHKLIQGLEKYGDFSEYYFHEQNLSIGRGQRLYVVVVASALDQAEATVFSQMRGLFDNTPWFKKYIAMLRNRKEYSADKFEIRFTDKLYIKAEDSNSSSLVGKTIHTLLFDEISRMDVSDSELSKKSQKRSAQAVYQALSKGTTTFANDRNIVVVSAPMYEDDFGMQLLLQSNLLDAADDTKDVIDTMSKKYPQKVEGRAGFHSSTFSFNPTVKLEEQAFLQGIKISQPLTFSRDYLALPPAGINVYFEYPEKIDECIKEYSESFMSVNDYQLDEKINDGMGGSVVKSYVAKALTSIRPNPIYRYYICCDPAQKKDSFTFVIGHGEWVEVLDENNQPIRRLKTVIDYMTAWVPNKEKKIEVHFENVEDFIKSVNASVKIATLTFDHWNSASTIQKMQSLGIHTKELPITLNMWEVLKQKVSLGLLELPGPNSCPESERAIMELKKLQLVKGGEVDHPSNFGKDRADGIARVNWLIEQTATTIYGSTDKQAEAAFLKAYGKGPNQEILKQIFPVVQKNTNLQGGSGFFMIGVSG